MANNLTYDVIGSYLAPDYLAQAREEVENGQISADTLALYQDKAFNEIVEKQIEEGLEYVTSGELRRNHWGKDFYLGLSGIERVNISEGSVLQSEPVMTDLLRFDGRIAYNPEHPFFHTLTLLSRAVGGRARMKQTIPSPTDLYRTILKMTMSKPEAVYESPDTLIDDIATAYNKTIRQFYHLGCRQIQLDDTVAGRLCNPDYLSRIIASGVDPMVMFDSIIDLINRSLANLPDDLVKSIYISGGNPIVPEWSSELSVDNVMIQMLQRLDVDKFYLPFDIDNLKALEILKYVAPRKQVVLGLVSAHNPMMESPEKVLEAVDYASRFIPRERLSISPMSGFKLRSYISRGLSFNDQWNKIHLLRTICEQA
ncbi:MAG: hypothetical protein HDR90_02115 [Bacteroides sp.]|nr:hypothetical protein [Bacteroides sp.]